MGELIKDLNKLIGRGIRADRQTSVSRGSRRACVLHHGFLPRLLTESLSGSFDVAIEDFYLNQELNKAPKDFVERHGFLSQKLDWEDLKDRNAARTLGNAMPL